MSVFDDSMKSYQGGSEINEDMAGHLMLVLFTRAITRKSSVDCSSFGVYKLESRVPVFTFGRPFQLLPIVCMLFSVYIKL